jgi:transposase
MRPTAYRRNARGLRDRQALEQQTGVAYHPGHVWKLLRRRMGWRLQRTARRAVERDVQAIARWVAEDWS